MPSEGWAGLVVEENTMIALFDVREAMEVLASNIYREGVSFHWALFITSSTGDGDISKRQYPDNT